MARGRTPMADERLVFPEGFRWGVATASHQFEGNTTNNQWYAWEQAGHIKTGDRSGQAAGWWTSAERDFDRARDLGLNALRLSLEWSRIEPRPGEWDDAALARYRAMLAALRERDIEPMVTLHHFTHPLWFEERGAFLARDAGDRFTRYAEHVVEALSDLCDFWCTINEPNVYSTFGYQIGDFPPGHRGDLRGAVRSQAALARAHAAAYRAIHRLQPGARVGWAQHYVIFDPARPSAPLDRLVASLQDAAFNEFFPRAVLMGRVGFPFAPLAGDLTSVRGTADYVGINLYYRNLVAFDVGHAGELFGRRFAAPGTTRGDADANNSLGELYPEGILRVARRLARFGKPLYVTENGVADRDDRVRALLLARAVRTLHDALAQGIDLRGYYHWSLVDNFEWAEGWLLRFGLIALDPETQERHLRRSAHLYGDIAHANALTAEMLRKYAPEALPAVFPAAPAASR
jgi:beta-glucosidase